MESNKDFADMIHEHVREKEKEEAMTNNNLPNNAAANPDAPVSAQGMQVTPPTEQKSEEKQKKEEQKSKNQPRKLMTIGIYLKSRIGMC